MNIQKTSQFTGKVHVMDLDITEAQFAELQSPGRRQIQQVVPQLTAEEREFLLTGVTPDEWKKVFG
jgi:hypothetical protein